MRSVVQVLLTILLNAFWQIAVVTLFAVCCSWLLRGTAGWCRHSVWVAALVISLCLPIITALNTRDHSTVPLGEVARSEPDKFFTRPVNLEEIKLTEVATATTEIPEVEPARQNSWSSPISVNGDLAALLVALYAVFVLYRGVKLLRAWRRTTAIMRSVYAVELSRRAGAIIARCQTAIGVKRVSVVCSTSVQLPITAGVFNPLIILPEELLSDADEDILLSAMGHELVHVARRDYILNLVYELIYLPISFHPAAALLRRRIKQTRELCCDELVAGKLLTPELYARSLVRLVDSVPFAGRLAPDTTIGITDADILEVRIMSLLKTSKLSPRRNTLLLIGACLLLVAPCVAAAALAPEFEITYPETVIIPQQDYPQETIRKLERAREDLQRQERELEELVQKSSKPQGAELEKLRRMQDELREASARYSRAQESQHLKETEKGLEQLNERLQQLVLTYPGAEARMREATTHLAQLQKSFPAAQEYSRELSDRYALIEKQYPNAEVMAQYQDALRRAQAGMEQQKEALSGAQREKIEEKMKLAERVFEDRKYEQEVREKIEMKQRAAEDKIRIKEKIRTKDYEKEIRKGVDKQIRKELEAAGRVDSRYQVELTQRATLPMDRAIQIATSQHPGKVLSCSLARQKDGQPFYRLVIIKGDGDKSSATHVWVSATDGRILKTEHE